MRTPQVSIRGRFDRMGVMLSSLCAVHCLAGLVLVSVLGLGGEALLNPAIHRVGLALAVAIGAGTLGLGWRHHGRRGPLMLGSCGLALMTCGLIVPHGPLEAFLTIPGVLLLATAHIRNLRHSI
jgi:hypothetical protein